MDNFTLAVVVGIGIVLCILGWLVIADKGPPDTEALPKSPKKRSS